MVIVMISFAYIGYIKVPLKIEGKSYPVCYDTLADVDIYKLTDVVEYYYEETGTKMQCMAKVKKIYPRVSSAQIAIMWEGINYRNPWGEKKYER